MKRIMSLGHTDVQMAHASQKWKENNFAHFDVFSLIRSYFTLLQLYCK